VFQPTNQKTKKKHGIAFKGFSKICFVAPLKNRGQKHASAEAAPRNIATRGAQAQSSYAAIPGASKFGRERRHGDIQLSDADSDTLDR